DNGGKMPAGFADMMNELSTEKILVHPSTGERYTWVGSGKSEEEPDSILAYGPAVEGGREVLLGDGSVQQVTAKRFDEMLAKELTKKDASTFAYQMDPVLARRYGLSQGESGRTLAESREKAAAVAIAAPLAAVRDQAAGVTDVKAAAAPFGAPVTALSSGNLPTVAGLRSLKIEVPKSGRPYQFTRVLNLDGEPPSLHMSVMSTKAFIIERTLLQLLTFIAGLLVVWRHWRRPEPKTWWLAVGAGLVVVATANLFIAWRALHLVLIVSVPALLFLAAAWLVARWLQRRRVSRSVLASTNSPADESAPPLGPVAGATASVLLWLAASGWVAPSPASADNAPVAGPNVLAVASRSNLVSVVGASLIGTAHERVAQIDVALDFSSAGTNQTLTLFGSEVAVQEFVATKGEVRLWREGPNVGVLLPSPGAAAAKFTLLIKLGGDVGRRTLELGIPPALGTKVALLLDEPEADVEFPGAVAFSRTNSGAQTRVEAVVGATNRLALAWAPRFQRAADAGATVFAHQSSLITLENGVVSTRSLIEFTTPQGELRSVKIALPTGQRLIRVSGDLVRGWDQVGTNREVVITLLKSAAKVTLAVETEAGIESLPTTVALAVPRPIDVKRTTGMVAVRAGEDWGLNVARTTGLERIEAAEFVQAFADPGVKIVSAWRFLQPEFELAVLAEMLAPKVEAVARNQFSVGFDHVAIRTHVDYSVTRAGVFNLRLAMPAGVQVDNVVCPTMLSWNERAEGAATVLELSLKERTLGAVAVDLTLTRSLTNLPSVLDLAGMHPLGVEKLASFVSVASEPGIGLKVVSQRGLTEIPASAFPGAAAGAGLLAFKQLAVEPAATPSWALELATETIESWVRAEVAGSVTISETLVSGRSVLRYDIQNAPVKEFRLRVPAAWRNVEITGSEVRRRDQTNSPTAVEWRVELQNKVRGEYRLTVQWEEPRTGTNGVTALGVQALGVERETGTVAFYTKGQLQLLPRQAGDELLRVDPRELPSWAENRRSGDPVLSYRYLRPGWNLPLEVKRFSDAALLQALVDQARLRTVVADDGQMMTQLELIVRNNGRQHLELTLPPGAEVWSATVDGEPVRPAKNGGKLLLPLEAGRGSDAPLKVELTYVGSSRFPRTSGRVELTSPRLDVPLKEAMWEVFLPPDHAYTDFGGTMTYESADLVPVAQDFTVASYRRQELEKEASLESQAVEFLSNARKEVAEGKYDNASRLGFFRSRGVRDERAKLELKALEDTVSQAQSSNLLQAQRAYALNNSLHWGAGTQNAALAGLDGTYEAEVAARQIEQLNRAQAVAVARVTPLRVNLPTRGLRHTFGQVLQTEVDRPLTVTFHTRNEQQTGWVKTLTLWGGGFLGLWLLAFVAVVKRPERGTNRTA
ncbi:MAG TPA: hypothetical protein DCE44_16585, partial [Verrucomicrobiales bacterium]|nr:hypothetical protein [Verrucomicrobiales bacterium]